MLAKMRAEVTSEVAAKLQSAAESKRAALTKLAEEAKMQTERAVAEERKRGASDKEMAVRRVFNRAEALMKGVEVKLKTAIEARNRAEALADVLSVKHEAAEKEMVKFRIQAQMFHKVSMILRLRLAVVATKFTSMHCSHVSVIKRTLGRRIVLLEERYERDVVMTKARSDAALKRAIMIERSLLQASNVLGLQNESKGASRGGCNEKQSAVVATLAMVDGAGTGSAAREAQSELQSTQDRIFDIKARLYNVREELHKLRQRRNEIIGGARMLDVEINVMGRQIAHSDGLADEVNASRMQRLHKNLEASAAAAERVRDEIVPLEREQDALKDERRGLKARARTIEARVLERVVKQHVRVRAVLHEARLQPSDLLPARMALFPEPEPLRLELLHPRTVLDVDGFAFDLGRRDYLRARATGRAAAARQARESEGLGREGDAIRGIEATGGDFDDEDASCPVLRLLPSAIHSEQGKRLRDTDERFIREHLQSSVYNSVVADGHTGAAAAGAFGHAS